MKLIVTGGAGFIGSNFVLQQLSDQAVLPVEKLVVVDKLTYAGNRENLKQWENDERYEFIEQDIGDRDAIYSLLQEYKITHLVHFAAESHVDRSIDGPEPFFQANVMGTLSLLEAFRAYYFDTKDDKSSNKRFLHVSTDEVYGSLSKDEPAFKETNAYLPNSPYAASKAASDHLVRSYYHTYKLPVLTTNCSNNYGPYQFPEKLIPLMILNALDHKNLPIYGDGKNVRDWLFVEDHTDAIAHVLMKGQCGATYNIGGEAEMMNVDVIDTICTLLDALRPSDKVKSYQELKTFVKDRPGHDRRYAMDITKIGQELNWKPRMTFAAGMKKTVQWYLDNAAWCESIAEKKYQRQRLGVSS
ncbi:MAG: dTDP-glucose 4,6-dehydratase [Verrucomicrobiota bacterium]